MAGTRYERRCLAQKTKTNRNGAAFDSGVVLMRTIAPVAVYHFSPVGILICITQK